MVKRSRLSRGSNHKKNSRMKKEISEETLTKAEDRAVSKDAPSEEVLSLSEEEAVSSMPLLPDEIPEAKEISKDMKHEQKSFDLGATLHKIKEDVNKEFKSLGDKKEGIAKFMHEVIYLDDPDAMEFKQNLEVANRLDNQHPNENVLLKAELHDEPVPDAGMTALVRVEDFLNFENVEATTPDGSVYTIPRKLVREFVGVAPQSASIEIPHSATTLGGMGEGVTMPAPQPSMPVEIGGAPDAQMVTPEITEREIKEAKEQGF